MPPSVVVVITEDPRKSAQPVEALRIALGLSASENPLTIALLGDARLLLSPEEEDIIDGEILEKYLPSIKQLGLPFLVPTGTKDSYDLDPELHITELPAADIIKTISAQERALVF